MPPKSTALKGRKSGVAPRSNATVTDSAAKTKRARADAESDDENVDTSKRSKPAATTDESAEESDDGDVEASLVPATASPAKKAKEGRSASKKSKSTSSTGVTEDTEESAAKEADETMVVKDLPKRSKIQNKDSQGRKVRKYTATTESGSVEDGDSDEEVASSASNGQRGTYHWDLEVPTFKVADVGTKLTNHDNLKVRLHRDGEDMKFTFLRGQKIFVLPDPSTLPPSSRMMEIEDLPDDLFWVARIVDLVKYDQSENAPGTPPLGVFKVQWMYSGDHALELIAKGHLHPSYKGKIAKYRFAEDERIESDHTDYVSIQAFAGFADGIDTFLRLEGLFVSDEDRLKPEKKRSARTRNVILTAWNKKATEMAKYDRKDRLTRKAPDSAASAPRSKTKKTKKPASSSQAKSPKKAKKPSSSQAKAKKTSSTTKKTSSKKSKKAAVLDE